jgi:hypothetical protein
VLHLVYITEIEIMRIIKYCEDIINGEIITDLGITDLLVIVDMIW